MRHRPGGVGLRSEHPGITGAMGPSTSWDSWPTRSREGTVGTQECTQIGENGLCVSTAAARLASSPRQQPTQTPDFGHIRTSATSSDVPGPSRGPSGCPRGQRLTGLASTSARRIPGSVSAGQGCLPRLLAIGLSGSTRASSLGPGHHGARLVEEAGPPRALGPALPPSPYETRLPAQRPSVPTVPSWRRDGPPTADLFRVSLI